jgi:aspartyl protease family protein
MAYSSATRSVVKLAVAWVLILGSGVATVAYFNELRSALGLTLAPEDFGTLTKAPASDQAAAPSHAGGTVQLRAGNNGHFHTTAHVNGRAIEVMVDTGASMVALTWDDARQIGIHLRDADFRHRVSTANGTARVAAVTLDAVSIGDITVRNVRAVVAEPGKLGTTLLGMTFLGELTRTEMSRGQLILQQ